MNGAASAGYLTLASMPMSELEKIMVRGETPDPEALAGWEWRGTNVPSATRYLGILKFIKGFYKDDQGRVFGYNEPAVQTPRSEPWVSKPSDENPKRFGFFSVEKVDATRRDNKYLNSLLFDYGKGGNPIYDITSTLRDYVVRVDRGSDDLLLGKAYGALGPIRLRLVTYFVLERLRPTGFRR